LFSNVGEKQGGFHGVWKNWVLFKNEDNKLETLILEFGFPWEGWACCWGRRKWIFSVGFWQPTWMWI